MNYILPRGLTARDAKTMEEFHQIIAFLQSQRGQELLQKRLQEIATAANKAITLFATLFARS